MGDSNPNPTRNRSSMRIRSFACTRLELYSGSDRATAMVPCLGTVGHGQDAHATCPK